MNDTPTLAPRPHHAASPDVPAQIAAVPRRRFTLAALRRIVATWGRRMRLRRELERKLRHNPHLIDDIGLTQWQAEVEIAKPFWQRFFDY